MLKTGTELTRVLKLRDAMGVDSPGYPFNQIGRFAQSSTTPKAESPAGDAVTRKLTICLRQDPESGEILSL